MITLDKVKIIREGRKKKVNNPDQGDLFNQPESNKSEAQKYTDKINKQNKNRPESRTNKRVFPGDKSGAYQAAKSDLEAREALKKAGASGDVSKTAGPEIRKKVETKRQARVKSLRLPDTSFGAKLSKKPIRPFGKVGRDKAPEGLFGAGDTKGQMTTKRMDTKAFKKTQPTSDLLPKSFKDFDKKIKSLKVDVDIEKRVANPKTASKLPPKVNKPISSTGANQLAKKIGFRGTTRKTASGIRAPEDFIQKVKRNRASRKSGALIQKDLFGGQSKVVGSDKKLKKIKDIRKSSRSFKQTSGKTFKQMFNPDQQAQMYSDAGMVGDSNATSGGASGRTVTGDTPKSKFPPKITRPNKGGPLVVTRGSGGIPPKDPTVVSGKFFDDEQYKKLKDAFNNAKRNATSSGSTGRTAADAFSQNYTVPKYKPPTRGFGGAAGKRAFVGKAAKGALKYVVPKTLGGLAVRAAGVAAANYLLTQRRDSKIRAANQRILSNPNTPKLSIADTTFNPNPEGKRTYTVGKK